MMTVPGAIARSVAAPRSTLAFSTFYCGLSLIQEQQIASYWRKNGHKILVKCQLEAGLEMVLLGH